LAVTEAGGAERGVFQRHLNLQIHGLRGLAALLVFIYHAYGMPLIGGFWPAGISSAIAAPFLAGQLGVEIFFVISGYLITASLIRHDNVPRFLLDRAIRIHPAFISGRGVLTRLR